MGIRLALPHCLVEELPGGGVSIESPEGVLLTIRAPLVLPLTLSDTGRWHWVLGARL